MASLNEEVGRLIREKDVSVATVESATGGLISHLITNIPGISGCFRGSVVAYSNEAKIKIVGVKAETIKRYGAVSAQVAEEMAAGGRKLFGADICISDTGIAGPSGATPTKPVGLFYIGLSHKSGTFSRKHLFTGTRLQCKKQAAAAALGWVKEYLTSLK